MRKPQKVKISTFGSRITSAVSVSLVLVLLGMMTMALVASHGIANDLRSKVGIIVKMLPSSADVEVNRVQRMISSQNGVASYEYSSPEKILDDESAIMGEDLSEILDQNPFGGEFEIKVFPVYAEIDSIERIASILAQDPAVDEIITPTEVVGSVNSVLHRISYILLVSAMALLVISIVLINNTVSLDVYSHRFVIHTMKLVGATGTFIRRPFFVTALVTGIVAAAVGIILTTAVRAYSATFDPIVEIVLSWANMAWIYVGMFFTGPIICIGASLIATNRYLRATYDDMFK